MDKEKAKEVLALLKSLKNLGEVDKILSTFIPAFEQNRLNHENGEWWLHGSFLLGGTVSGRLSSSKPNLTNLPSTGTKYAKTIKQIFQPPEGWIMVGADFSSLENRIQGLLTKDPNVLAPYIIGYDGHSLRAYAYFKEQMPDIIEEMAKAELQGKFYKVTHDDGTIEYKHESEIDDP